MTMAKAEMLKEIEQREAGFASQLKALGNADLATAYIDISTLRRAYEVLARPSATNGSKPPQTTTAPTTAATPTREDGSLVLRVAVRETLPQFKGRKFTTRQMFDALKTKYPADIDDTKLGSISATLANMSPKELTKIKDGQRKIRFEARQD